MMLCAAWPLRAEQVPLLGTVSKVRDGDTLVVERTPVRLQGVAAPERNQPLGREATRFLRALVLGREVVCHPDGSRSWDRIVARCYLDGQDLGAALVAAGLARDCPRYSGGRYRRLELRAAGEIRIRYRLPSYCRPR